MIKCRSLYAFILAYISQVCKRCYVRKPTVISGMNSIKTARQTGLQIPRFLRLARDTTQLNNM